MTNTDTSDPFGIHPLRRVLLLVPGSLGLFFGIGIIGGTSAKVVEKGFMPKALVAYAIATLLIGLGGWMVRRGLRGLALAKSPRRREYQIITLASLAFGGALGMLMQIGVADRAGPATFALQYEAPIYPVVALVGLISLPVLALMMLRWHRAADEHESAAYNFGGILSLYAYFFASVGWWLAWRGGFVGEPDGFAIFWMVMIVWTAGWLWRRYR